MDRKAWIVVTLCAIGIVLNGWYMNKNQAALLEQQKLAEEARKAAAAQTPPPPQAPRPRPLPH